MKICVKCILTWIGIAVAGIVLFRIFGRKKQEKKEDKMEIPKKNYTETDAKIALEKIMKEYGKEIAGRVEQIYRLETSHFKSAMYKITGSAGRLWTKKDPEKNKYCVWIKPVYKDGKFMRNVFTTPNDPAGKKFCYYVYDSVYDAMKYLADYLRRWGLDAGTMRWGHGTDTEKGKKYLASVTNIKPRFV